MIKSASILSQLGKAVAAVRLDAIIAELDSGNKLDVASLKKAIALVKGGLDIPNTHLSSQERADEIIEAIQGTENPFQYAMATFNQDFLSNHHIPHVVRLKVATFLFRTFGDKGNPIWKNYTEGKFVYLEMDGE